MNDVATAIDTETSQEKILRKCRESMEMKEIFFREHAGKIEELSREMARRFRDGKKMFSMGNGGSLCDALHIAVEFNHPIIEKRKAFPVIPLMTDISTVTAISNDLDFTHIYVNQLKLFAHDGDMVLAVSTSGKSPNLVYALETGNELDCLTIAFSGKDGGRFPDLADFSFIVPSFSVHRIQEVHGTLLHILWDLVHIYLGEEDVL